MSSPAAQKQFNRWIPRLTDRVDAVRHEAASVIVDIINKNDSLRAGGVVGLVQYLRWASADSYTNNQRAALLKLYDLELKVLRKSPDLLAELISIPPGNDAGMELLLIMLLGLLEEESLERDVAAKVVDFARAVAEQPHGEGRQYALKISDWGEDNLS